MEQYFNEYFGKKVRIRTEEGTKDKIIEGILEDGIRVIIVSYIIFENEYAYSVKVSGIWYNILENGIMILEEYDNPMSKYYVYRR